MVKFPDVGEAGRQARSVLYTAAVSDEEIQLAARATARQVQEGKLTREQGNCVLDHLGIKIEGKVAVWADEVMWRRTTTGRPTQGQPTRKRPRAGR